jgi:hypothetical protein
LIGVLAHLSTPEDREARGKRRPTGGPHFAVGLSIRALWAVSTGLIFEDLQANCSATWDSCRNPIRVERGLLAPPARRGQGIVLDDAALRRHEVTGEATDVGAGAPPRTA